MSYLDQFEKAKTASGVTRFNDPDRPRVFLKAEDGIVRLAKVGGEWSVSKHSHDFFEGASTGSLIAHPSRFPDKEDAVDWMKFLAGV